MHAQYNKERERESVERAPILALVPNSQWTLIGVTQQTLPTSLPLYTPVSTHC